MYLPFWITLCSAEVKCWRAVQGRKSRGGQGDTSPQIWNRGDGNTSCPPKYGTYMSEIFLPQLFRATTFGERPRQAADAAHLLLLAGSQRRCSVDRAGALKVCLRSVEIFDWKD